MHTVTETIIGAAMGVHRTPGPGLVESAYEPGLRFERQAGVPAVYAGSELDGGCKPDAVAWKNGTERRFDGRGFSAVGN